MNPWPSGPGTVQAPPTRGAGVNGLAPAICCVHPNASFLPEATGWSHSRQWRSSIPFAWRFPDA